MRNFITNLGLIIGSFFWSAFVKSINNIAYYLGLPISLHAYFSVFILLGTLMFLPVIFDALARNYECFKRESEIQNMINTRYFYYQLVNIYVTVAMGNLNVAGQVMKVALYRLELYCLLTHVMNRFWILFEIRRFSWRF
jgi:hypothetical protein